VDAYSWRNGDLYAAYHLSENPNNWKDSYWRLIIWTEKHEQKLVSAKAAAETEAQEGF
jgi:hypothetical protein